MGDNLSSRYYRYRAVPSGLIGCHDMWMGKKTKRRPNFIRQWRKFRKISQEQLAELVNVSQSAISDLENAQFDYVQSTLEPIAKALRCEPADLIGRPPDQTDIIREVYRSLDERGQKRALALLKALRDSEAA